MKDPKWTPEELQKLKEFVSQRENVSPKLLIYKISSLILLNEANLLSCNDYITVKKIEQAI